MPRKGISVLNSTVLDIIILVPRFKFIFILFLDL